MCRKYYCPCDVKNKKATDMYRQIPEDDVNIYKRTNNQTIIKYEFIYFHNDESINLYNNFSSCYDDV